MWHETFIKDKWSETIHGTIASEFNHMDVHVAQAWTLYPRNVVVNTYNQKERTIAD